MLNQENEVLHILSIIYMVWTISTLNSQNIKKGEMCSEIQSGGCKKSKEKEVVVFE